MEREILASFAVITQMAKVMTIRYDKGLVKMEKTLHYKVWYCPRFQASHEGVGMYPLQMRVLRIGNLD